MTFPIHVPSKKHSIQFKAMLKEAKKLNGASYHRILFAAMEDYLSKLRKDGF